MRGMLDCILNAIEEARKAEGKTINIGILKYTIRYMDGMYFLLIDESEVLATADGQLYISTIAKVFLTIIKEA